MVKNKQRNSKFFKLRFILYIIGLLIGLAFVSMPLILDIYSQFKSESTISSMSSSYSDAGSSVVQNAKNQANLYNQNLVGAYHKNILPYDQQLNLSKNGVMSYLEIPKISIKMPIFHGTEQNVLMAGIGHLSNSSLPVGGQSCHCVMSAHSGMSSMRAFDDLHKLEYGDKFTLWTLSEPYAYEVYDIEVVEPYQTESLIIRPNQDLCTLITCTPYGVNTHRLLVHAKRCSYSSEQQQDFNPYINSRTIPLIIGSFLLIICLIVIIVIKRRIKTNIYNKFKNK